MTTATTTIFIEEENIANVKLSISLCNITDNGDNKNSFMIINHCGEFIFENNNVKYTDATKTSGAFSLNKANKVTITDSEFNNCNTNSYSTIDLINQNENSQTFIRNCQINNCITQHYVIRMSGGISELDEISISFDDINNGIGGIEFNNKKIIIEHSIFMRTNIESSIKIEQNEANSDQIMINDCTFDSCQGTVSNCISISSHTTNFEIKNIIIQNIKQEDSGYLVNINCNNKLNTILLDNISFINNECKSDYGGGSGLFIIGVDTIWFSKCQFINNYAIH